MPILDEEAALSSRPLEPDACRADAEPGRRALLLLGFSAFDESVREERRVRDSCCEMTDMEDWRGGEAK